MPKLDVAFYNTFNALNFCHKPQHILFTQCEVNISCKIHLVKNMEIWDETDHLKIIRNEPSRVKICIYIYLVTLFSRLSNQ